MKLLLLLAAAAGLTVASIDHGMILRRSPDESSWFVFSTPPPSHPTPDRCSEVSSQCTDTSQLAQASRYCSSLVSITVVTNTVAPTTITVPPTCTPTLAARDENGIGLIEHKALEKRHVRPPSCFGPGLPSARVSSCNCLTFTTHTRKVTVATATVTGPFKLEASGSSFQGRYSELYGSNPRFQYIFFNRPQKNTSVSWLLNQDGYLVEDKLPLRVALQFNGPEQNGPVFVARDNQSLPILNCDIADNCALDCKVNFNTQNYICYGVGQWSINHDPNPDNCNTFQPVVAAIGD